MVSRVSWSSELDIQGSEDHTRLLQYIYIQKPDISGLENHRLVHLDRRIQDPYFLRDYSWHILDFPYSQTAPLS